MLLETCTKQFFTYLRVERDCSKKTVIAYRRDLAHLSDYLSKEKIAPEVETITSDILRDFITYLVDDLDLSISSVRRKIHCLKSFFKYAVIRDIIPKSPVDTIRAPKKRHVIPIYFPEEDLKLLLEAPMQHGKPRTWLRDKLLFDTFAYTGIRRQELLDLDWRDVRFSEQTLKIRSGKGDKDRLLPLPPSLVRDLQLLKSLQKKPTDYSPVFTSVTGKRLSTTPLNERFHRYLRAVGLEEKGYTIHKLRHSFATLLLNQEVDLITIQELMGHADLASTRAYLHVNADRLREGSMKHPLLEGRKSITDYKEAVR